MRWLTRKLAAAEELSPDELLDIRKQFIGDITEMGGGLPPVPSEPQVIEFEAGDQLIVQCEHRVPRDVYDRLRAQLNSHADDKVIILEAGLKLVGRRKKEV